MKELMVLICFILVACKADYINQEGVADGTKTYLALGDSYTIGESVARAETWPAQLIKQLNDGGEKWANPTIIAQTGWTSGRLKDELKKASLAPSYDLVSLLIGVNNQFQGLSANQFRGEFKDLLKKAIDLSKNKEKGVIVLSIPDWAFTPFGGRFDRSKVSAEIDVFNEIVKEETLKMKVKYYDITPISRKGLQNTKLVANDGLHPSAVMYGEWVSLVLQDFIF